MLSSLLLAILLIRKSLEVDVLGNIGAIGEGGYSAGAKHLAGNHTRKDGGVMH